MRRVWSVLLAVMVCLSLSACLAEDTPTKEVFGINETAQPSLFSGTSATFVFTK